MKTSELREPKPEQLLDELIKLRQEQFNLRMKRANGALEKPHLFREVRRTIARIKTIMTEKVRASDVE